MNTFDIIVIGAGGAGLSAAITSAGFGKKVLLIEEKKTGGECTWSGCVPSKALINIANEIYLAKKYSDFDIDTREILKKVRGVSQKIYMEETPEVLESFGIKVVIGHAKFLNSHSIKVGREMYNGKKFILATGSSPFIPPIKGIDKVDFLTNESFFEEEKLPDSIIILGAGPIGCELGQAMNRLGVEVSIVEMAPRILFREEEQLTDILRQKLEDEGVKFYLNYRAIEINQSSEVEVTIEKEHESQIIKGQKIFVSAGRVSNKEGMNLEGIGLNFDRNIEVDNYLRTKLKHIYAAGDLIGPYQLSHMANYQGKVAALNAILPFKKAVDYRKVAWTTFTKPEFSRAGMTEIEARKKVGNIKVYNYSFDKLDRAKTKEGDMGEIKLITNKRGKILGISILADRSGELICESQVVRHFSKNFANIQGIIHPYPTYADSLRRLAQEVYLDQLQNRWYIKLIKKIRK